MGTFGDNGFTPSTGGELTDLIRAEIDASIGAQDYGTVTVPTIEGGWTLGAGRWQQDQEERAGILVDGIDPRRSRGAFLDSHCAAVGLRRRAATFSTYTIKGVTTSGTSILTAGSILQDNTADANLWSVVSRTTLTTTPAYFAAECSTSGPVALPSTVTFRVITPTANTPTVTYASADAQTFSIGRARETDPELQVRRTRSLSSVPSPTIDGIRAGVLALTWCVAASVIRTAAHSIAVYVHPAPVGATQEQEAIDAVGLRVAAGTLTVAGTGTTVTGTYTLADGSTRSITVTVPAAQTVAVVVVLAYEAGLSTAAQTEAQELAEAVVDAVFASLDVGQTLRYAAMYSSIYGVDGVTGLTLTLNGGTADVAAGTSTTQITVGAVTIT